MSNFLNAINVTTTENGAVTNASTGSKVLDYFSIGSALRTRTSSEKFSLFREAYKEDKELAIKTLFYSRDPRGGQGERQSFRDIFYLYSLYFPEEAICFLNLIPFYGRWDDLTEILGTLHVNRFLNNVKVDLIETLVQAGVEMIKKQLEEDTKTDNPSLLAKWMPSVNTSSKKTKELAHFFVDRLGMSSEKEYRRLLSSLRNKIRIVESKMSSNSWEEINFEHVPSQASRIYRKAFRNHVPEKYAEYLSKVMAGKAKINSSVTYPYEIIREYFTNSEDYDETLELLWKNLPDYTNGSEDNTIVVCDTSGSMYPHAITVSMSLAIYFAERSRGKFKDHFITFSGSPKLQKIAGDTLRDKISNLVRGDWGANTDLIAVFNLILSRAKAVKLSQDEMPKRIVIVSDMEFDIAVSGSTNFEEISRMYQNAGYDLPKLVFWNVESRQNQFPVTEHTSGVSLVSGSSPSIFKAVLSDTSISPMDTVIEVLSSERYEPIAKAFREVVNA